MTMNTAPTGTKVEIREPYTIARGNGTVLGVLFLTIGERDGLERATGLLLRPAENHVAGTVEAARLLNNIIPAITRPR